MKNVVPRFGKRDLTSFMDLTYMDHAVSGRKIDLPRVMMRHMAYVILVKDHELPYGDWMSMIFDAFGVPLVDKKGEEPKRYNYFEETFLTMCKLKREDGIWWIGTGENRRRDDVVNTPEEEDRLRLLRSGCSSFDSTKEATTSESTPRIPLVEFGSGDEQITRLSLREQGQPISGDLEKARVKMPDS
ncbi:hypothetical protein Dimus_032351 [Dionaea muscipula]